MKRFQEWSDAHQYARDLARQHQLCVAIRKVKEYGKTGYNVGFVSTNDSDYVTAEIVRPGEV